MTDHRKLLLLAGKLADAARDVVGGMDLNGFQRPGANVWTVADRCKRLNDALEAYDRAIMKCAREKEARKT